VPFAGRRLDSRTGAGRNARRGRAVTTPAAGYFRPGRSWLHRRNPLTKLLALLWLILAAFLLPSPALVGLIALVALAAASTGLFPAVVRSLRVPALLFASILIVNACFYPGAHDVLARLGPLAVTREGLGFGLTSAGRLLVAFSASVLFLFTTLADDMLEALVSRGVSHRIAFVVLSAVQMVPRLQARAGAILEAQQARGLDAGGSPIRRAGALVPLAGPLLLGSLIDVRERTFALEARAFGARPGRTAYRLVPDPAVDRWLRLAILAAMVGLVVVAVARPIR
jgi:energy-coupling factor transport system permease protein